MFKPLVLVCGIIAISFPSFAQTRHTPWWSYQAESNTCDDLDIAQPSVEIATLRQMNIQYHIQTFKYTNGQVFAMELIYNLVGVLTSADFFKTEAECITFRQDLMDRGLAPQQP